jgi:RND family efflux transporter MFP subunit
MLLAAGLLLIGAMQFAGRAHAAELECLIKPETYVEVSSAVDSILEEVLVVPGDRIEKGQPIAKLEASVERAKVRLAKLQAEFTSDIDNRKEHLRFKKLSYERMQQLVADNSVPQYEEDKARTEYILAQTELEKARENQRMASTSLDLARSQLSLRTIRSPIDGIVVDVYAAAGESVEGRSIMRLAQVDPLKVEVIAPTEYFGLIVPDMEVEVLPEQPANRVYKATVNIVDKLIDPASGSFTVRMALPNPKEKLVAGVNCLARFDFETPSPGGDQVSSLNANRATD